MLKFEVELESSIEALKYIQSELSDLREFYEELVYPKMLRDIETIFEREGRPTWDRLSDNYAKWKQRYYPGLPILQLSGNLRDSYTITGHEHHNAVITERTISVYSSLPHAALHESGTDTMPARPVIRGLMLDSGIRNQYNKQFRRHVQKIARQAGQVSRVGVKTTSGKSAHRSRQQIRKQTRTQQVGKITRI